MRQALRRKTWRERGQPGEGSGRHPADAAPASDSERDWDGDSQRSDERKIEALASQAFFWVEAKWLLGIGQKVGTRYFALHQHRPAKAFPRP